MKNSCRQGRPESEGLGSPERKGIRSASGQSAASTHNGSRTTRRSKDGIFRMNKSAGAKRVAPTPARERIKSADEVLAGEVLVAEG